MPVIYDDRRRHVVTPRPAARAGKPPAQHAGNIHPLRPAHASAGSARAAGHPNVVHEPIPHWAVGHGAGQNKPPSQSKPYYQGQKPAAYTRAGPIYTNPQWVPPLKEVALVGLSPEQLAYMRRERRANALKIGADARWLLTHPAVIAGIAGTLTIGPEADLPLIEGIGELASGAATLQAVRHHHYSEALLDSTGLRLARSGLLAARSAAEEERLAARASDEVRSLQKAIETHPPELSSRYLRTQLNIALTARNAARETAVNDRFKAVADRALASAFGDLALWQGGTK